MEKNNDLITVIEELLEADMTAPKKVKNPQNKMAEEEQVDEAQDKTDKSIAVNKLTSTAKPKADNTADNSSEVIGSNKGAAMDAGGDKDVGKMDKGKLPSDAADNSSEVIGSNKGAALDAGGDKDVGPDKKTKTAGSNKTTSGFPSDASAEAEANKGPHDQSVDEDLHDADVSSDGTDIDDNTSMEEGQDTKIVKNANDDQLPDEEKESMKNMKEEDLEWDWDKIDSLSEEDFQELVDSLSEEDLAEFNARFESLEEAHDDDHDDDDDDDKDDDDEKESMKNMKEADDDSMPSKADVMKMCKDGKSKAEICDMHPNCDQGKLKDMIDDCKGEMDESVEVEEEMEWDWEKIEGLTEEEFHDFYSSLNEDEQSEIEEHYKEVTEAKDKGDMDKDGIDEPDGKEYMDNKDKAIKAAMKEDEEEVDEATGEKLEKAPTTSENEPMRPTQEKGDNAPVDKGGDPGKGPHDQSKDANETPTKANPKKTVKEETDELMEDLEVDFKEKAAVIFETAVNEKASIIREEIEAEYSQMLEEKVDEVNERVNQYMDYVVNEWLEENQLEIKYSLRTEIAENFIREMKTVFETNFIDIPEEEVSVVDELTEAVESYKEQIEEQTSDLEAAKKELLEIKRKEIVEAIGEDLPQTQKIRLEKLSENVEANDIEEFRYKVEQLKEGYFDESSEQPLLSSLSEEVFGGTVIEEEDDSTVSQYAKFLSKTVTK